MPIERISLTADDFEKAPRESRLIEYWRAKHELENPLGPFAIELSEPPDDELLRHVNELATFVSSEYDSILNVIFESYQRAAEDKYWLRSCNVPRRLRDSDVKRFLLGRAISVRRDRQHGIVATIDICPQWDEEHGIELAVVDGKPVFQLR